MVGHPSKTSRNDSARQDSTDEKIEKITRRFDSIASRLDAAEASRTSRQDSVQTSRSKKSFF